jgi:hypothetical protein
MAKTIYDWVTPNGEPAILVDGRILYSAREREGKVVMTRSTPMSRGNNVRRDIGIAPNLTQAGEILLRTAKTEAANIEGNFQDRTYAIDSVRSTEYGDPTDKRMQL